MQTHSPVHSVMTAGIRGSAVLDLESRLKDDVLREAAACGGRILVHQEMMSEGRDATVKPRWCVSRCVILSRLVP